MLQLWYRAPHIELVSRCTFYIEIFSALFCLFGSHYVCTFVYIPLMNIQLHSFFLILRLEIQNYYFSTWMLTSISIFGHQLVIMFFKCTQYTVFSFAGHLIIIKSALLTANFRSKFNLWNDMNLVAVFVVSNFADIMDRNVDKNVVFCFIFFATLAVFTNIQC